MSITHSFVNPKADGGDATITRPSDWNADHVITGLVNVGFIGAQAINSAVQVISTGGSGTAATFDTDIFDTDNFHSTSSNTNRMTIPAGMGGKYLIQASGRINYTSGAEIWLKKNGTTTLAGSDAGTANVVGTYGSLSTTAIAELVAGDWVEVLVYQGSGSNKNFGEAADEAAAVFSIIKLDAGKIGEGVGVKVYNSATQNISDNTITDITFNSEEFDTDGFHSTSVDTDRIVIPSGLSGKYIAVGGTFFNTGDADGVRIVRLRKNGVDQRGEVRAPGAAAGGHAHIGTWILDVAAGDYIELCAFQNSGAAMDIGHATETEDQSHLSLMRLDSTYPVHPTASIGARIYKSGPQAISHNTTTDVTYDSERWDTDSFHSGSDAFFTIPAGMGGKYLVGVWVRWAANASGYRYLYLTPSTSIDVYDSRMPVTAGDATEVNISQVLDLAAGATVRIKVYQTSGGDLNVNLSEFWIMKLDSGKVGSGIGAQAYNSTTQSVNDSTETALTLDSEIFDTDGFHSTSSDTSRMTIPAGLGGKYLIIGNAYMAPDADGVRVLTFRKNGTTSLRHGSTIVPSSANSINVIASTVADLTAGEYVELIALHTAGAALNVGHASSLSAQTTFSIMRLDSGTSAYTGARWGSGTAFPSGPIADDRFTRTDRDITYIYDGTRWLSDTLYRADMGSTSETSISATGILTDRIPAWGTDLASDLWMVDAYWYMGVGATNTGSVYWTTHIYKIPPTGADVLLTSGTTQSLAANTNHLIKVSVNALIGTNAIGFYGFVTKVSTPSAIQGAAGFTYRLVG